MSDVLSQSTDLVYPLGDGSIWYDNELRLSLRSFHELYGDLGRVWIVGRKPSWLGGVRHIEHPDAYPDNADANLISKVIRVCLEPDLSPSFVFSCDDHALLLPTRRDELLAYSHGDMSARRSWGGGPWAARLRHTRDQLQRRRLPAWNYEGHVPYLLDKHLFPRVMLGWAYGAAPGLTIFSTYFNSCPDTRPAPLAPALAGFFSASDARDVESVERMVSARRFLSYNDAGLTPTLRDWLLDRLPRPSPYEADGGAELDRWRVTRRGPT